MRILLLDNYDSFTYNLYHLLESVAVEAQIDVRKNDEIALEEVIVYDRIVLSPGPGLPQEAGVMPSLIRRFSAQIPILGVCLGMQAIAEAYGGKLRNLPDVSHGQAKNTLVTRHDLLFDQCPEQFLTARYHSWIVDEAALPAALLITARDEQGNIMALKHQQHPVRGVQFHPESILSECGPLIMANWLRS